MLLEARDVTKAFGSFKAVDAASVTLEQGDILGLIGPNGAGKSTFFNCLTGDLLSTSGQVLFEGQDITGMAPEARAQRGLARTFQVPQTFESMSVLENVMIGAFLRTSHRSEAEARARAVLERVGMGRLADSPARSLGTPGRKRLEIARALATEPRVLLLDEAMAGLTQREVQLAIDLVRDIHRSGITLAGRSRAAARAKLPATRPSSKPISANAPPGRPRPTLPSSFWAGPRHDALAQDRAPRGALWRPDRGIGCFA